MSNIEELSVIGLYEENQELNKTINKMKGESEMEDKKAGIEEMEKKLREQFDLLHEVSKECEPEYLEVLTESMIKIYTILYPFRP
ncbi:MAG: hypothetical protein ACLUG2_04315 [Clostridium perfringens]|uniref:hypothetical protein n=1 Tax=Clostridium perfringens TaxID=1502 RepID=UPI002448D971|nr:hypothetical protein [Clostridium perfringens]MDH2460219.1 hypothetical protein [Clostridium perfringens]MDU1475417.1 hypothetical protein [Clostridium perfringens]